MSGVFTQRLQSIENNPALLQSLSSLQRGVEKESLRVSAVNGQLAQTPHAPSLGSALTHPKITTDFSESQLEFITPVSTSVAETLEDLNNIHHYTYHQLQAQQEMLWSNSMPCQLGDPSTIPVGRYGTSNVGMMKTVYRLGLGHRYGSTMQTISGVHYNFSLVDKFWTTYQQQLNNQQSLCEFKTEQYFNLMRNFRRYVPLFVYLFGASPAISRSFLQGQPHKLQSLGEDTLYGEYATALRMGGLGYQSDAQKALFVCYNSMDSYIESLRGGIMETYADYDRIGLKDEQGNYKQLNTSLLQIENEFYSTIRPKRVAASGEAPINALLRSGVEYVEVRCVDVDPFASAGIAAETMRFLDVFLLYCLLEDSPELSDVACKEANTNLRLIVDEGRRPGLTIQVDGQAQSFSAWAERLLSAMQPIAALLDKLNATGYYQQSLQQQQDKVANVALTPSAKVLARMRDESLSFAEFGLQQAKYWQQHFLSKPLSDAVREYFTETAADSLVQQRAIEAASEQSFEDYLANYYEQYKVSE